jgi:hypothetical protein
MPAWRYPGISRPRKTTSEEVVVDVEIQVIF